MFSSGGEAARSDGRVASPVLIPKRFVWPHGGRNVYLTGSFTRWSEHLPMTPVEGCPTVFQTICSLTPGYHEYKFFVDGEWRHDESKHCVNGSYGLVNTLILGGEPDHLTEASSAQISSVSNMDLDNEAFVRMVRVSDTTYRALSAIPQADLEVSRCRLSDYMFAQTVYELLPDSGKVIALDINLPVKQAFHILYEQGIPLAPLWDSYNEQFVGVLSPLDFILILRELGNHGSNLSEEELELHTISAWKEEKAHLNRRMGGFTRASSRSLIYCGPHENLKSIALKILQYGVATIPILYSPSPGGSYPQLLHLASLSGILKCICRYFKNSSGLLPVLQLPICAIPVGTWVPAVGQVNGRPLVVLRPSASLSSALNLFLEAQVSSIPIVDDNGSLLNIYSRSDIIALAKDKVYARVNLDEMTIQQAVLLGQDSYNLHEFNKCQVCLRSDPLFKVMECLAKPGVRRLVIVESGTNRVEGIVTLSDIFRFLLG
ncbi:AMP-activated serine/threonine-protein kinase regulatory subunit [Ancistrocladus abbreviatus]